jgi:hypothetical protein
MGGSLPLRISFERSRPFPTRLGSVGSILGGMVDCMREGSVGSMRRGCELLMRAGKVGSSRAGMLTLGAERSRGAMTTGGLGRERVTFGGLTRAAAGISRAWRAAVPLGGETTGGAAERGSARR